MPQPLAREAACQSWTPYCRHVADLLRLKDWAVAVSSEAPDEGSRAMVCIPNGRRYAEVSFSDDFLADRDESEQRQTVVHELLHCHFEPAALLAKKAMGDKYEAFLLMYEYANDAIADAVAPLMPLPSEFSPPAESE